MELNRTSDTLLFWPDECDALGIDRVLGQWPISYRDDLYSQIRVRRQELAALPTTVIGQTWLDTLESIAEQLQPVGE